MLSKMAQEDCRALLAEGITLSFEQAVTLNALGLMVERGPYSGVVYEAPRVAWAGPVALFEPTIQSEQWYIVWATEWWKGTSLFWALAWACAHATRKGFFHRCQSESVTRSAIQEWANRLPCTLAQLNTALDYVIRGTDVQETAREGASSGVADIPAYPHAELIDDAMAAGLGLSPERIAVMPRRRVVEILRKWVANQMAMTGSGKADLDAGAKTDAYVRYDDYLISIRNGRQQIYA